MKQIVLVAAVLFVSAAAQPVFCQGNSQGHGKGNQHNSQSGDSGVSVSISFGGRDREIIRDYFQDQTSNLPPGLAKRGGNLPPGLQKHLERDGTLPPGLQKRIAPFPVELERRLPPLPSSYHRVLIGEIAIILDRRSQRIMDVIHDVLRP